jgi:hypothetical protein
VPHGSVNKVLDLPSYGHLITLLLEHVLVEGDVVRDKAQVERKVGVLELVAVALFVELVGGFLGVALDDSVEVFQALFLVGAEFGVVQGGILAF